MTPDEKANLEAELRKAKDVLEVQPDNEYFKKRKTSLEKQLK
jgi:hypothetical protein